MTRTASIGIRFEPDIKAAAEKATADDHRTLGGASVVATIVFGRAMGHQWPHDWGKCSTGSD
jgi:hypothetical protein